MIDDFSKPENRIDRHLFENSLVRELQKRVLRHWPWDPRPDASFVHVEAGEMQWARRAGMAEWCNGHRDTNPMSRKGGETWGTRHPALWLTLGPSSVKTRPPRDDNPNQDQNQIGFKVEGSGQEC